MGEWLEDMPLFRLEDLPPFHGMSFPQPEPSKKYWLVPDTLQPSPCSTACFLTILLVTLTILYIMYRVYV